MISQSERKEFFENLSEDILTIEEVSVWLKVKESFLRALIYQHRIPFFKLGRLVRFRKRDLEKWMASSSGNDSQTGGQE